MIRSSSSVFLTAIAVMSLVACRPPAEAPDAIPATADTQGPSVHETMTQTFTPDSNRLWELAGNLYDDDGALDADRLSDPQWQEIAMAAGRMREVATTLAEAASLRVVSEGMKIQTEGLPGSPSAADVQALINADTDGFREESRKLAAVAGDAVAAVQARDAVKMDDASNRLNEACASCHNRFWHLEQSQQ